MSGLRRFPPRASARRSSERRPASRMSVARPNRRRWCRLRSNSRRSESYYETKRHDLRCADRGDRPCAIGQARRWNFAREEIRDIVNEIIAIKNIVMSISEQEDLLDDICNDVLGYGPLEPLLARDDIADIMVNGPARSTSKSRARFNSQECVSVTTAALEHLPAHRQPGRSPGRRIVSDLRCALARRLPRQRHRRRRWRSTALR